MWYIDGEYYVDVSRTNRLYDAGRIDHDVWEMQLFGYLIMAANEDIDFAKKEAKRFGIDNVMEYIELSKGRLSETKE